MLNEPPRWTLKHPHVWVVDFLNDFLNLFASERLYEASYFAHLWTFVCNSFAPGRYGHSLDSRTVGTHGSRNDNDLYPRVGKT